MRFLRLTAATAAVLVLTATAAVAHPSFNPNAVPVGEAVDTVLVIPHGCSTTDVVRPEDDSQAVPTTRVDLQLLDGLTIEPRDVDGWDAMNDGEAIVWTDAGGATTDPIELPVTLTATDGAPGDRLHLAVHQECADGSSVRWTTGSSDTPAVRLDLTEGETGTVEAPTEHGEMDRDDATDEPTADATTDAAAEPTEDASDAPVAEVAGEPRSSVLPIGSIVVGLLAGVLVALALVRRRNA